MEFTIQKDGNKLSGFDVNDLVTKNQLKFRARDWITFPTREEAEEYLNYLKRECRQKGAVEKLEVVEE